MTKHDPTEEAETLPGIPRAGSDLERFPSVPGIVGGGAALSLDVETQELITTVTGEPPGIGGGPDTATISAVVVARSYVILQGHVQPGESGATDWQAITDSMVWELTNPTTVSFWCSQGCGGLRVRFKVIEYL